MEHEPKQDRITWLRVRNFRSLADVTLELSGLTVLIGENGSGKSSLIEVCEVLRSLAQPGTELGQLFTEHPSPVRVGAEWCSVAVRIEGNGPKLEYAVKLSRPGHQLGVLEEVLDVGPIGTAKQPLHAIQRNDRKASVFDQFKRELVPIDPEPNRLLLTSYGDLPSRPGQEPLPEQAAMARATQALRAIDVHLPFEVLPAWAAKTLGRRSASRESSLVQPAPRLDPLAANLANVFHGLKNNHGGKHWQETLEYVRLGLGDDVDDVNLSADAAGGHHALAVRYKSQGTSIPASGLSDGTLAYLAFVALLRLNSNRSLLAFDEPELHLHPQLLIRVVSMFEQIGRSCPVLISTHSDRLLDALTSPADSAVLCTLDDQRTTKLVRPDKDALQRWLRDYGGLGELRAAGLEASVMPPPDPAP